MARPFLPLLLLLLHVLPHAAEAQATPEDSPPRLRASPQLQETIAPDMRPQLPVFVFGDRATGSPDSHAHIEGNAELRRGDTVLRADHMDYQVPTDRATASGNVTINQAGNRYAGNVLELHLGSFTGFFSDVRYQLLATQAHGEAERVDFLGRDHSLIHRATYTACQRTEYDTGEEDNTTPWQPDWQLRAKRIHLDHAEDVGTAEGGVLEFKGVPILAAPYLTFPLSGRRKSGLLPPTLGLDNLSGVEYAQPYYWNIAPNRDATITPVLMSKRGAALGLDVRYLEPAYHGEWGMNYLPRDWVRGGSRWAYSLRHHHGFATPLGALGLHINIQRVGDNDYWRDFSHRTSMWPDDTRDHLTQRLLPGDATLHWASGTQSLMLRTLRWQTLQDVRNPITPPYDRSPQLHWRANPSLGYGLEAALEVDTTHFQSDTTFYRQPNGRRSYALASLRRPFTTAAGFITPRLQLHSSHYAFSHTLANGQSSATRTVPTFSLDSGLVLERDTHWFGRDFLQTLEPRAFYTYTPYRSQHLLPVYDTAAMDFNFASIYSENAFGGQDRIADNNLLTFGVTTRLLDPASGSEAVRLGIAQRLRFSDQKVTMPGGLPVSERLSDILLGAGLHWTPQWGLDATVQYNPKNRRSVRSTVAARWSPGPYRSLSAAWRMHKLTTFVSEPSEQLDIGWQWPLGDLLRATAKGEREAGRWYSVGRLNYSLRERRFIDTVLGLEYESCCWTGRVVLERLQRSYNTSNTRIMFQLELRGFSRLSFGSNPLSSLRHNVPGYRVLGRSEGNPLPPSRFSAYD